MLTRSQHDLSIKLALARDWTAGEGYRIDGTEGVDVALGLSLVNDLMGSDSSQ